MKATRHELFMRFGKTPGVKGAFRLELNNHITVALPLRLKTSMNRVYAFHIEDELKRK